MKTKITFKKNLPPNGFNIFSKKASQCPLLSFEINLFTQQALIEVKNDFISVNFNPPTSYLFIIVLRLILSVLPSHTKLKIAVVISLIVWSGGFSRTVN
jgi:hypothetical protein